MRQSLFESLTRPQTPRRFWLVLDIPDDPPSDKDEWHQKRSARHDKILSDLSRGELEGVRGISATKQIMTDWFVSCRNATLVMDPEALLAINDIEEVRYDDIDYLSQDNFRVLYRLFQKENGRDGLDHQQLMMNILPYWLREAAPFNRSATRMLEYTGYSRVADYYEDHYTDYQITDYKSAAAAIFDMWSKADFGSYSSQTRSALAEFTKEDILDATKAALLKIGSVYADEAEWIIKGTGLHVPKGSTLLVAVDPECVARYDEWKQDVANGEPGDPGFGFHKWSQLGYRMVRYDQLVKVLKQYRLADHYNLRIVDAKRFNGVDLKVARRKRDERLGQSQ